MQHLEFHYTLPTLGQLIGLLVQEAMKRSSGNLACAAKQLGIPEKQMLKAVMREFDRISDRKSGRSYTVKKKRSRPAPSSA